MCFLGTQTLKTDLHLVFSMETEHRQSELNKAVCAWFVVSHSAGMVLSLQTEILMKYFSRQSEHDFLRNVSHFYRAMKDGSRQVKSEDAPHLLKAGCAGGTVRSRNELGVNLINLV